MVSYRSSKIPFPQLREDSRIEESHLITKKAPGDRHFSAEEIRQTAALIMEKSAEGKVSNLPGSVLKQIVALLKKRPAPSILEVVDPDSVEVVATRVAQVIRKKEIPIRVVDLGKLTGFPRDRARPSLEVMLLEKRGELFPLGRNTPLSKGETPTIFITSGFYNRARTDPNLLLQSILHPVLERVLDFPHMMAVLCESAYNAKPQESEEVEVSDLNRFIAEEAARDRDFSYFDRILGTQYEPDEFRVEELEERFGDDVGKKNVVIYRARSLGVKYRKLMEDLLASVRWEISSEHVGEARTILDQGDPERALTILRRLEKDPSVTGLSRNEVETLIDQSIRCFAIDADPSYEGLRLEKGEIKSDPWAGKKAREFADLLKNTINLIRATRSKSGVGEAQKGHADPLGELGSPRIIHVSSDLERPSAKFIDGHDRVHWVFEKSFVEAIMSGYTSEHTSRVIPPVMACRFVRDGAFPDEKLKIEKQYGVAVKGALEGYRFFQSLGKKTHSLMASFYEVSGITDPLYELFISLGAESNIARASHMIRDAVAKSHSYNYVRYPDTSLSGKVIVITGGGTGMGRALALEAAIRGGNVVITGRRPDPLEETRADMEDLIRHLGLTNRTLAVQGDVSDPKYVGEMFDKIRREFGRIDVLYNNAGVSGPVEFGSVYREGHFDDYREAVNIHLTGAWLSSLEAAKRMEHQAGGGLIVMVGTFYSESIHRHILHAYPGRLPYTSAQSAKLALGDYLAWTLSDKNITVLSLNPSAVSTERIQKGSGVFDKGSRARARIGRHVTPESLEMDTLDRTVSHEFVLPRDFARVALDMHLFEFRRTVGGQRIPMGGVTYEQPPGVIPSPASLERYPDMTGKVSLVTIHQHTGNDRTLVEASARALSRSGAHVILAGNIGDQLHDLARDIHYSGNQEPASVFQVNLENPSEVQELFGKLPRLDLLVHFTGSVDWKRPLTNIPYGEWTATVDRYGFVPRLLCWQAERRMDRDGVDGTIIIVGPDLSGVPSIRERDLVHVFQAMLRPAVATESMERALMRKAHREKTAPSHVSDINIDLVLPGRTDGRNKQPNPERTAASILWLTSFGKQVSGAALLPDEVNSLARLPLLPRAEAGKVASNVVVVTGGIRNLGKEISLKFAAEGATVVPASRHPALTGVSPEEAKGAREALDAGKAVTASIRALGGETVWVDTDISIPRRVRHLIEETANRFGRIDAFVNNAGAGGDFSLITDVMRDHRQSWESVMRSNFLGPWYSIALLREIMGRQEEGGSIVNVSTHYSDHPYLFRTIYTVSKIAVKALTLALTDPLSKEGIFITDVAPSLIAGPRMDWVMRNYAEKFAAQFDMIDGMPPADIKRLREHFLLSFDRALPPPRRERAANSFLSTVKESNLPRATRSEMDSWYGKIGEWFRSTVPAHPPTNEQVADGVLFGAKNGRFLEDRFIGVSSLPPFVSFPPVQQGKKQRTRESSVILVSIGHTGIRGAALCVLGKRIEGDKGQVTQIVDSTSEPGQVNILRHLPVTGDSRKKPSHEKITRELTLSDPKVLEPWVDSTLLGGVRSRAIILFIGRSTPEKPILDFSVEEMEGFISLAGKALSSFGESLRAVEEDGHVIAVVPPPTSEEGHLIRATLRQMVRTALAEQHFLFASKRVNISLLSQPDSAGEDQFHERILDILRGESPAYVEAIPVGPERA